MDTHQPANPTSISIPTISSSGMFGTKIPTSVAFIVAVLLFFMPLVDIRCNNMSLQQLSGIQVANGFYIAVVAFLAAAFFAYKQMSMMK